MLLWHYGFPVAGVVRPFGIFLIGIRLVHFLAVDQDRTVPHLNGISAHSDNTLDKIAALILGITEDDNLAPPGITYKIAKLVHDQPFMADQGGKHRRTFHQIRFKNKSTDTKGQSYGHDN